MKQSERIEVLGGLFYIRYGYFPPDLETEGEKPMSPNRERQREDNWQDYCKTGLALDDALARLKFYQDLDKQTFEKTQRMEKRIKQLEGE